MRYAWQHKEGLANFNPWPWSEKMGAKLRHGAGKDRNGLLTNEEKPFQKVPMHPGGLVWPRASSVPRSAAAAVTAAALSGVFAQYAIFHHDCRKNLIAVSLKKRLRHTEFSC